MNNIFKSNNRFSVLNEDNSVNIIKNKIRNEREKNSNSSTNDFLFKRKNEKMNKMGEKNLSIDNFPQLCKKERILEQNMNFLEKMKNSNISQESELDIDYKNLKPGWLLIKRDPLTNKIYQRYKKGNDENEKYLEKNIDDDDFTHNSKIINTLIELHKKRMEDYIELWGYDDWENTFRFPNHDYEYFDKLDESDEDGVMEEIEDEQEIY